MFINHHILKVITLTLQAYNAYMANIEENRIISYWSKPFLFINVGLHKFLNNSSVMLVNLL